MSKLKLSAKRRKTFGRKVKSLRSKNIIPATVYGKDVKSKSIKLDLKSLKQIYEKTGETGIIDLDIKGEKKTRPVLIHNLQIHPVNSQVLHVELHQVDLSKKVSVNIPIETIGKAPAVEKGGVLFTLMDEIEVEALPADLPEKFVVDISSLKKIGQSIILKDLDYDKKKVNLNVEDLEAPVVKVEEPEEEVEPEPEPEQAEGEIPEDETEEAGSAKAGQAEPKKKSEKQKKASEDKPEEASKTSKSEAKTGEAKKK